MQTGPREIVTPFRPIPLDVPEGMKPNEFFNSTENLDDLVNNNGLLLNPENLLLYRKALGHSNEFDASIIYNTSKTILNAPYLFDGSRVGLFFNKYFFD